jgi:hypothetical protein
MKNARVMMVMKKNHENDKDKYKIGGTSISSLKGGRLI